MNLSAPVPRTPRLRRWRAAAAIGAALLLASCGGSTDQYEPFIPARLIAFGDDASALADGSGSAPRGASWSVNGVDASGAFNCALQPIWIQSLGGLYGFVFEQCNPNNVAQPQARTWAVAGARVADIEAQIAAQTAAGGIRDGDLVTLYVGTHDIVDLYRQYPQVGADSLRSQAQERGAQTARLANRLVALGARVLLANLPDLSYSPYALNENVINNDGGRSSLVGSLVQYFNIGLGITVVQDGRYVGWVDAYLRSNQIGKNPASYGFTNAVSAVCAVAPPGCRTDTLVTNGNIATWLWSNDRFFSPGGHAQLADLAIQRAINNPF